jgi:hypothetical protein
MIKYGSKKYPLLIHHIYVTFFCNKDRINIFIAINIYVIKILTCYKN